MLVYLASSSILRIEELHWNAFKLVIFLAQIDNEAVEQLHGDSGLESSFGLRLFNPFRVLFLDQLDCRSVKLPSQEVRFRFMLFYHGKRDKSRKRIIIKIKLHL